MDIIQSFAVEESIPFIYRNSVGKTGIDPDEKYYQNTFIAYDNERRVQQHQIPGN